MGRARHFTDEELNVIRSMTEHGATQHAIADELKTTKTTIRRYQIAMGLKASNKWKFGESVKIEPDDFLKEPEEVVKEKVIEPEPIKMEEPKQKFVAISDMSVRLTGAKTGFGYECSTNSKSVKIVFEYSEPIEIDVTDLVTFGNELLDVADILSQMKTNTMNV